MSTISPAKTVPGSEKAPAATGEGEVINERYQVLRRLGRGGMGTVYLVLDRRRDNRLLALKRVRSDGIDAKTLALFEKEFLTVASLRHPNLTRVYDFGVGRDSRDLFFTSEFIDGPDWFEASQALDLGRREDLENFLELLAQVLRGLEFIHCRGMVHGDLKPGNVLICGVAGGDAQQPESHRVKLIDFGLTSRERECAGGRILGTPYYVAPETIVGSRVDRRTDLYSLGVVLYLLAARRLPFSADSKVAVLKSHLEENPLPPEEASPSLPPALGAIILRLLKKKPGERFQGALEVLEAINHLFGLAFPLETRETSAGYLDAMKLMGRKRELAKLEGAFLAISRAGPPAGRRPGPSGGGARLVILRGEEEMVERRLVEELRQRVQTGRGVFLELECAAGKADVKVAAGPERSSSVLEDLVRPLEEYAGRPEVASASRAELVRKLLEASRERPLVVHFHDLKRARPAVLQLVSGLLESAAEEGSARASRLLLTTTAPEEVPGGGDDGLEQGSGGLQQLSADPVLGEKILDLVLRPLGDREVVRLLRRAFPGSDFPAPWVQKLCEECDGSLQALLEALALCLDREVIRRVASGWVLCGDGEDEGVFGGFRRRLAKKIDRLPADALRLAKAYACMGKSASLELAAGLAGISAASIPRSVELLVRERILRAGEKRGRHSLYFSTRPRGKEVLYQLFSPSERVVLHDRAGALCEERYRILGEKNLGELAYHYMKAGNRLKGVHYGLEAARELGREFAPLKAIEVYLQVLTLVDESPMSHRCGLEELAPGAPSARVLAALVEREIADLRFQVGDYKGALELLWSLSCGKEAERQRGGKSLLYLEMGRAHIRLGDFEEAAALFERAEREVEDGRRQGRPEALVPGAIPFLFTAAEYHHERGFPEESLRYCARLLELEEQIGNAGLRSELYTLLAENHLRLNERKVAASYYRRAIRLLDLYHDPHLLALSLFNRGKYCGLKHRFAGASRQLKLSMRLRRKLGDAAGRADCLLELGILEQRLGRPRKARSFLKKALALYRQCGRLPRRLEAQCALGEVYRLLGEYESCQHVLADALERAQAPGSATVRASALLSFAGASIDRGDLENAGRYIFEAEREMPGGGGGRSVVVTRAMALKSELAFQRGETKAALEHAAEGLRIARRLWDPPAAAELLALRALFLCESHGGRTAPKASALLGPLYDLAKQHRLARMEGWAWLLKGMLLTRERELEKAHASFSLAAALLKAHGRERDLVQYRLEHGLLYLLGGRQAEAYIELEEGYYLARKLNLAYMKCKYIIAMARFEMALAEGGSARADEKLRLAEGLASQAPYPVLLEEAREYRAELPWRRGKGARAGRVEAGASSRRIEGSGSILLSP